MSQFSVIQEIYKLAQIRDWEPTNEFAYGRGDGVIYINRTDLGKYKTEYKKSGGWLKAKKVGYTNLSVLPKIDNWLIECIRSAIPESNYYTFVLHTIDSDYSINAFSILTYKAKENDRN